MCVSSSNARRFCSSLYPVRVRRSSRPMLLRLSSMLSCVVLRRYASALAWPPRGPSGAPSLVVIEICVRMLCACEYSGLGAGPWWLRSSSPSNLRYIEPSWMRFCSTTTPHARQIVSPPELSVTKSVWSRLPHAAHANLRSSAAARCARSTARAASAAAAAAASAAAVSRTRSTESSRSLSAHAFGRMCRTRSTTDSPSGFAGGASGGASVFARFADGSPSILRLESAAGTGGPSHR